MDDLKAHIQKLITECQKCNGVNSQYEQALNTVLELIDSKGYETKTKAKK